MLRRFEAAVEFCACLAWHFHELDAQMQFQCDEFETQPSRGAESIYDILRFLAKVEPALEEPLEPLDFRYEESVFRIVCTALPHGSVPTNLWSRSYFIFFENLKPAADAVIAANLPSRGKVE